MYKCGPNRRINRVFRQHAASRGYKVTSLRFLWDGVRVGDGHKKCQEWRVDNEMDPDEVEVYLDCVMEQIGGRY